MAQKGTDILVNLMMGVQFPLQKWILSRKHVLKKTIRPRKKKTPCGSKNSI